MLSKSFLFSLLLSYSVNTKQLSVFLLKSVLTSLEVMKNKYLPQKVLQIVFLHLM